MLKELDIVVSFIMTYSLDKAIYNAGAYFLVLECEQMKHETASIDEELLQVCS